jgi:hypothetical protein
VYATLVGWEKSFGNRVEEDCRDIRVREQVESDPHTVTSDPTAGACTHWIYSRSTAIGLAVSLGRLTYDEEHPVHPKIDMGPLGIFTRALRPQPAEFIFIFIKVPIYA